MKLLDHDLIELRPICIPNLTVVIIALQVVVFFAATSDKTLIGRAELNWSAVMAGGVAVADFRDDSACSPAHLSSVCTLPLSSDGFCLGADLGYGSLQLIFLSGLFSYYRYAAISPDDSATGIFLQGSIFLAFATYFPRFELRLFFILPVQVRWLAYLQALGYGITIVAAEWNYKLMTIAALGNYIIFFSPLLWTTMAKKQKDQWEAKQVESDRISHATHAPLAVSTAASNPIWIFDIAHNVVGNTLTASEHIRNHEHKDHTLSRCETWDAGEKGMLSTTLDMLWIQSRSNPLWTLPLGVFLSTL